MANEIVAENMKMIDIIIPCYNAHKTLDKTLKSIINQSIKDKVNVLLVDDCSSEDYESFIDKYKDDLNISVIRLDSNSGPGLAREKGIENTSSEYFTFIDGDDAFYDYKALEYLFDEIEKGFDLINSIEYDEKRKALKLLNGNVHGKMYRRKYILDNDIHFNDTRIHEDNFFNNYVFLSGARYGELKKCTYLYSFNKESVTNATEDNFDRLELYFINMEDLLNIARVNNYSEDRIKRFKKDKYEYFRRIYNSYLEDEKELFGKLVDKYEPDFWNYLELTDDEFEDMFK